VGREPAQAAERAGGGGEGVVRLDHLDTGLEIVRHPVQILGGKQHLPFLAVAQEVQAQEHLLHLRIEGLFQTPAVGAQLQVLGRGLGHLAVGVG
jgi:hypothetical protein